MGESQSVFRQDPVSFPPDVPNDEPLTSLESLLGYYDEAFVRKAYITLLRRHPDPGGLNHFLNKLRQGRSRLSIVEDIHASEEGRNVEPHIPGVDDAIGNVKRERSVRARLLRRLRRGNSSESEIDMLAGRTGEQLTSRGGAHDAAVARVTDLQATLQEISRILGHHSVPALAPPIPIARAEGDMPVVQRISPVRRATDRCIFLLVGLYSRFSTILSRLASFGRPGQRRVGCAWWCGTLLSASSASSMTTRCSAIVPVPRQPRQRRLSKRQLAGCAAKPQARSRHNQPRGGRRHHGSQQARASHGVRLPWS